jgi:branched-chain amino acid transport system substrate-binding protein
MTISCAKWVWLAIALAALTACNREKGSVAEENVTVVRIGQVSPLTGPQAHLGKDNDSGVRLAVEELNASGIKIGDKPARIEVYSEDDQTDPRMATIVAQKLADKKVNGVIGHLNSGTTIPASKIYHDAGIPQISPSATAVAYTAQGFNTAFRVMTNDRQQGAALGRYAVTKLGAKKVAIIDDRTAYGQGLADEVAAAVKANGGEVIAREFTSDRSTDFMAILTSVKARQPDLVFYGGMDAQGAPMIKQLRALGLKATFMGGDGTQTHEFLRLAGGDAEGVVASSPGLPLDGMPGGSAFREKFESKYGVIQNYAPYAYDAAMTLVEAMRAAGSPDPARYLPELARISRQGVTGTIAFDANGDIRGGAITMYRVKDGNWTVLETLKAGS